MGTTAQATGAQVAIDGCARGGEASEVQVSGKTFRWHGETIERAVGVLNGHDALQPAIDAMSKAFGWRVTRSGLDCALSRAGLGTAFQHLRSSRTLGSAPPPSASREVLLERDDIPVTFDDTWDDKTDPRIEIPPAPPTEAELSARDIAEHRARAHADELRSANKRLIKDLADREEQIALLKELRAAAPPRPIVERHVVGATQRQGVPVMLCSDWHIEEPVRPASVNGLNEYNLEIADRCISRMAEAFAWMLRDHRYDCRAAVVWLGGDLLSGYIHEELVEANFLSPTQAALWLQPRIEQMLRTIAAECPTLERILVPCNDGNHGRLTNRMRISTRTANSIEWYLYQTLAARMADDPRFEFQIADGEWCFVDLFDRTYAFTHGDSFRYQGGVGGISIPLRRGINEMRKYRRIDHVSLGHFHQRSDFGDITVNGSAIGLGPYSMHIHASPEPRQQSFFMVDAKRGKSISAPIWL